MYTGFGDAPAVCPPGTVFDARRSLCVRAIKMTDLAARQAAKTAACQAQGFTRYDGAAYAQAAQAQAAASGMSLRDAIATLPATAGCVGQVAVPGPGRTDQVFAPTPEEPTSFSTYALYGGGALAIGVVAYFALFRKGV